MVNRFTKKYIETLKQKLFELEAKLAEVQGYISDGWPEEEELIKCPKCGYDKGFDITESAGCEGDVYELHCWNCGCYFNPNTGVINAE